MQKAKKKGYAHATWNIDPMRGFICCHSAGCEVPSTSFPFSLAAQYLQRSRHIDSYIYIYIQPLYIAAIYILHIFSSLT